MSDRRLAISMIVGDDWRPEEIKPLLESIEPYAQGLFVNWNGTERKPRWGSWTSTPIKYIQTEWVDDFSKARMDSYRMIPKKDFAWWMWLDADDKLIAPEGLDGLYDSLEQDPYLRGAVMLYAYGVEPQTGAIVIDQHRERLMKTDWVWQWKWPIHEIIAAPQGTPMLHYNGSVYIEHLRKSGEDRGTRARNRRIIMRAMRENPGEPRHAYYFASECYGAAFYEQDQMQRAVLADAAIIAYQRYLSMPAPKSPDQEYMAGVHIAELFHFKKDYTGAIDAYLQAARSRPDWPDAWIGCSKACLELKDFERMRTFADIASKLPRPITTIGLQTQNYGFTPVFLRAVATEAMGNLDLAMKDYKAARTLWNDPENNIDERIKLLRKRIKFEATKVDPLIALKERRGTKPEKSIAFFTNPIAETWNQETLRAGGHGGAETLVLELAPRFAADGWRVSVYGCPGDAQGVGADDVEYLRSEDFLPNERHTVFVSSRAPVPFAGPIDAQLKLLWMHDVNIGPALRSVAGAIDVIVPISEWHKRHLTALYGIPADKMTVIPNGIDLEMYPEARSDDGQKFIWSSSPDRGLDILLSLWPSIREFLPDATLEVFYGWEFIDKLLESNPGHPIGDLKSKVGQMWAGMGGEEGGLIWHGRQSPHVLAERQLASDVWAYPTNFCETYCLTAVQAQASGCLPLTTGLAALRENVACDWLTINGWSRNSDYQTRFLRLIENVFESGETAADQRAQARRMGRKFAETQSIDASYEKWNDLFLASGVRV